MKPIFGIDITENKHNETVNGSEFIVKTVSQQRSEDLDTKREELNDTVKKSKFPLWLQIIYFITGVYAGIVICAVIGNLGETGLAQMLKNAPVLIISGLICGVIWLILLAVSKTREKKVLEEDNAEGKVEQLDLNVKGIYAEMGVPSDADSVDVLMQIYKVKDGEVVAKTPGIQLSAYINIDCKAYVENDALHIAELENVYAFPLSEIKSIKTVNKRICVPFWNKEEAPKKGIYKQYKMTVNNMGMVYCKPYYILELSHNNEEYGIYFPCYELPVFERLTGLNAEIQ